MIQNSLITLKGHNINVRVNISPFNNFYFYIISKHIKSVKYMITSITFIQLFNDL
jgi:hypothetical protein